MQSMQLAVDEADKRWRTSLQATRYLLWVQPTCSNSDEEGNSLISIISYDVISCFYGFFKINSDRLPIAYCGYGPLKPLSYIELKARSRQQKFLVFVRSYYLLRIEQKVEGALSIIR